MATANASRSNGSDDYMIADIARHVQAEHTKMVEQFMLTVDMFEAAQEHGHRIKFANFREAAGRKMRMSAVMHASALADLMDTIGAFELEEADREYIKQLDDYAAEIKPEGRGRRVLMADSAPTEALSTPPD